MTTPTIDWAALNAPFPSKDVSFRIQSAPKEGQTRALVVAYVDARAVGERLDEICGKDGWSFDWQPVLTGNVGGKPAVLAAKGILTIGGVSKADVGDAGDTEPTKASVSDSLKRAAVLWGIGRYLYDMPRMYAEAEKFGQSWYLKRGEEDRLRREFLAPTSNDRHDTTTRTTTNPTTTAKTTAAPVARTITAGTTTPTNPPNGNDHSKRDEPAASEQQMTSIRKLCVALGRPEPDGSLTYAEARTVIAELSTAYRNARRADGARA